MQNQAIGVSDDYASGFSATEFSPDGLIGMGFPFLSVFPAPPFFQGLLDQDVVSAPVFAFRLAASYEGSSELYLGGVNPDYGDEDFTWTNVTEPVSLSMEA